VSFTGYPLLVSLNARREEALREQREGRNPEALMFPTKTGKMFHHTAFNTDYLLPAAIGCEYADWPTRTYLDRDHTKVNLRTGKASVETGLRTQMVLTWHSLRHRFARICVDILDMEPAQPTPVSAHQPPQGWLASTAGSGPAATCSRRSSSLVHRAIAALRATARTSSFELGCL
jgi:hypothetical protein